MDTASCYGADEAVHMPSKTDSCPCCVCASRYLHSLRFVHNPTTTPARITGCGMAASQKLRSKNIRVCNITLPAATAPPPRLRPDQKNTRVWKKYHPHERSGWRACARHTLLLRLQLLPRILARLILLTCASENTSKTSRTVRTSSGSSGRLQSPGSPA